MKKKYPVIGLTGPAGSGKDTAADELVLRHEFTKLSFADPIYQMICMCTGIPVHELRRRDLKETPLSTMNISPRKLLQTLGTEWGRNLIREDLWILNLRDRLWDIENRIGIVGLVIPDVRFQNEVDFVHSIGGEVWHIERVDNNVGTETKHVGENLPTDIDLIIPNAGSIEQFRKLVLLKYVDYLGV